MNTIKTVCIKGLAIWAMVIASVCLLSACAATPLYPEHGYAKAEVAKVAAKPSMSYLAEDLICRKIDAAQANEILLKVLCHNTGVLVQSMYGLEMEPGSPYTPASKQLAGRLHGASLCSCAESSYTSECRVLS
jgi:hypothetical protein